MSNSIPVSIFSASTPEEIIRAAQQLEKLDTPQAIEPLAQLSRRAPGWLVTLLGLTVSLILFLAGFTGSAMLVAAWVWLIFNSIGWFLGIFYQEWIALWWAGYAALLMLWLWRDSRLRNLLADDRFSIPHETFTWLWVGLLWPFRALSSAFRLCVAVGFMTVTLSLPLTGIVAIADVWSDWRSNLLRGPNDLLALGFAAGALYLSFGLWVFGDWPRERQTQRSVMGRRRWVQFAIAIVIAGLLGLLIAAVSDHNGQYVGIAAGLFFFLILNWFLAARSGSASDFGWLRRLRVARLSARQVGFLKITLYLLGLLGTGVVVMTLAANWPGIRPLIPEPWLADLQGMYAGDNTDLNAYWIVESIIFGSCLAAALCALAFMTLVGLGFAIARPFAWPFFWLRQGAEDMMRRLRARVTVRDAVRHHRERNRRLTAGRGEWAVCRQHLARFEPKTARLAYGREWRYWWCRVCHLDADAYTGVRTIRGTFDQKMSDSILQDGEVLLINLLLRTDGKGAPMPLDLQEIAVDSIQDALDVESFVAAYQNLATPVKVSKIGDIKLTIAPGVALDDNVERMLKRTFRI